MRKFVVVLCTIVPLAACDVVQSPLDPDPTPVGPRDVNYTALGASESIGVGSTKPCVPFNPCPDGRGFVPVTARRLEDDGKNVALLNLGIPGVVLSPAFESIARALGQTTTNILEREAPFVQANATLVTLFAGGNDVNTVVSAIDADLDEGGPDAWILARAADFGRDLDAVIGTIRGRSSRVRIVVFNLPNLGALPYAHESSSDRQRRLQQTAVAFTREVNALASEGVLVIDLMCDPAVYDSGIYSEDGFHPNDAGYAHLAELTYAAATSGSAPLPQSSCAQMDVQ